jgi:AcrR family transcriptional regulator
MHLILPLTRLRCIAHLIIDGAMTVTNSRRRGTALEDAILDAAWAALIEFGYAEMTLESVAKRAGTSRPVLARRWPTRMKLATAAMGRSFARNPITVPDMGSVRDELRLLLRCLSDRVQPDLIQLGFDMSPDLADAGSNFTDVRRELTDGEPMRSILKRGVDRGEIDPDRLTPRNIALPTDLARHEILMTLRPLSDEVIREIVEDVFLPLVRGNSEGLSLLVPPHAVDHSTESRPVGEDANRNRDDSTEGSLTVSLPYKSASR